MAPPDSRTRPAGNRPGSDDLLAGGIKNDPTVVSIETAIVAAVFDARSPESAQRIVNAIATAPTDPLLAWALRLARRAAADGLIPSPVVCADIARQTDDIPPGTLPLTALFAIAADPPPAVNVDWLIGRYLGNAARRRIETAAARLTEVAWRGDLAEVEQAVAAEFHALRSAFEAARAVAG